MDENAFDKVLGQLYEKKTEITELKKELHAAKKLLWAAIYMNGWETRIPDHIMAMKEHDQEISAFYDGIKRETVLRTKVAIPLFTPSANEPDKA